MERSELHMRFNILLAVNRMTKEGLDKNKGYCKVYPTQVDGCTFQDMTFHLRLLKTKGLVDYLPRMLMGTFQIKITPEGSALVDEFQSAFSSEDPTRDERMQTVLAQLK